MKHLHSTKHPHSEQLFLAPQATASALPAKLILPSALSTGSLTLQAANLLHIQVEAARSLTSGVHHDLTFRTCPDVGAVQMSIPNSISQRSLFSILFYSTRNISPEQFRDSTMTGSSW